MLKSIQSAFVPVHPEGYRFVAIFADITQRKQYEKQIWRQAHFDTLTGLPNRSLFIDRLSQDKQAKHGHDTALNGGRDSLPAV